MPRFIADVMLGSLAKWLRILGYDTVYFRTIDDNELIKMALQQERTLLTRDTGIARSPLIKMNRRTGESVSRRKVGPDVILILSNHALEQLNEVLSSKRLFPDSPFPRLPGSYVPRCPVCNGGLAAAEKEAVSGCVPEYVFLNSTSFFICRQCGKVYWYGSHKKSIDFKLKQVIGDR
ncbi:MAG: Mut7-C RNAse domain-containing protein [Dissulfurispiraceae bacterium]|jgi:uncharacterized protein with PIN domain